VSGFTGIQPSTGHTGLHHHGRRVVEGHTEEEVVGQLAAIAQDRHLPSGIERPHQALGVPVDAPLGEGA
jgi:hypothetical protein